MRVLRCGIIIQQFTVYEFVSESKLGVIEPPEQMNQVFNIIIDGGVCRTIPVFNDFVNLKFRVCQGRKQLPVLTGCMSLRVSHDLFNIYE